MEKEFIPFEQALALKELGFGKECLAVYYTLNGEEWRFATNSEFIYIDDVYDIGSNFIINAPLYQQAFDWFREKGYGGFVETWLNGGVKKFRGRNNYPPLFITDVYDTYEEARLECLKKLIELCQ